MYPFADSLLDPKNCASKRVSRACDRCRLKKTKCDGRRCCNRCLADDAICVFSKRKRSSDRPYSSEYVQLLEDQQTKLVEGVQELYRRLRRGEGWVGPQIAEDSQGYPLVQDVLDSLAVLAPCERRRSTQQIRETSLVEHDDEDDEEEEQSVQFEGSGRINSTTPPLTPIEGSQSSTTSSPTDDFPRDRFSNAYIPVTIPYQQTMAGPLSVNQAICTTNSLLQNPTLLADGTDYWPPSSFNESAGDIDLSGFADSFANAQNACTWSASTFMML